MFKMLLVYPSTKIQQPPTAEKKKIFLGYKHTYTKRDKKKHNCIY
jgi:hypothetical protein